MNFNTSHVTVYRDITSYPRYSMNKFQYISCYGLSRNSNSNWNVSCIFQYISCYGLSPIRLNNIFFRGAFQYISCYGLSVTVYRYPLTISISIHLMLRFIQQPQGTSTYACEFQYISCYGLSDMDVDKDGKKSEFQYISCYGLSVRNRFRFNEFFCISIHLMLRFIFPQRKSPFAELHISIHLMLRFILYIF